MMGSGLSKFATFSTTVINNTETFASGDEPSTDNNFGNYAVAAKFGYKWHDLNADGKRQV